MNNFPIAIFGAIGKPLPKWRGKTQPEDMDDDDDLLKSTPPGVVEMLGFDPLEFDGGATDAQPDLPDDPNEDGDDDEADPSTSPELIEQLGFDPLELLAQDAKEDAAGHLHDEGNGQFTSGGGGGKASEVHAEAKAAASKSVREGLRKLFKTGYSFSTKELAEILALPEKTVKTALNFIKNPKKATAKFSTLELVQDPTTKQYSLKKMSAESQAQQSHAIPDPAEVPTIAKAPAQAMSTQQADSSYSEGMSQAAAKLQYAAMKGGNYGDAMLQWKKERALLMAQWIANTSGQDAKATPQALYQADKNLWDNLHQTAPLMLWSKAFQQWKADTKAEKSGNLKKAAPEYESTAPVYESPDAAKYTGLNKIPAGFKQIGKKAFSGSTAEKTDYYKGFTETHQKFEHGSEQGGVENKIVVQKDIEARLKGSKAFSKLSEVYNSQMHGSEGKSLVRRLISAWAGSSGDHNPISSYMQHIVSDVFGMKSEDLSMSHITGKATAQKSIALSLGISGKMPQSEIDAGLKDFVRAQYDNTQEFLKKQGLTEVSVARGMKNGTSSNGAEEVNLKLQPASSFSHSHYTAAGFAGGGTVYMVKVPASQVLGSYRTGYGCTGEQEVTLLAAPNMKAVSVGKNFAATANSAISKVKVDLQW